MTICRLIGIGLSAVFLSVMIARGGEFDRIEGDGLARLTLDEGAKRADSIVFTEIVNLPAVLKDTRSAFLVVKTGQGNYARVLATAGLQKPAEGQGTPVPVVVLERFDTFEPGKSGSRLARGAGLILFDGFRVDLDTGQVVPPGQGGDLEFRKERDALPSLTSLGKAEMFTFTRAIAAAAPSPGPSAGNTVVPGDFAGRYHLRADGRWSGLLELRVAADRQVTGRFRSEANGTSYPVTGQVSAESPQKAQFTIKFPRTEQEYVAFLWTEGKSVLAGSFTMIDRSFGFFAVREGAKIAPPE